MNQLKDKVLSYLANNLKKKILIDSEIEISSEDIVNLAIKINKKKLLIKKLLLI